MCRGRARRDRLRRIGGRGHRDQVLSNETTFTRWAYVHQTAWIHQAPRTSSPRVGRLTWYTPDGFPSVYLLLRAHWDAHGRQCGRRIWSAPVAVGKPGTPTPTGHFWIDERFTIKDPSSGYYPYAFGTTDYSTLTEWPHGGVVGIHGPYYDPQGIPGHISHGCIRLQVADDFWLAAHVKLGTPVHVV